MPVYLPPISRREFLKSSLATAALALSGGCASPTRGGDQWALLSDIHIAADPDRVVRNVNMTRNLQAVTAEVLAWPTAPSAVLINGDLAFDTGQSADYKAVLELVRPLRKQGLPIHLSMGNHDNRDRFWETAPSDRATEQPLPKRQITIVRAQSANWFILDSLIRTKETPGLLGDAQRAWLAGALDANTDKPALIAIHHQPEPNGGDSGDGLNDTRELLEILRPRRHVKAYFFGHTHRWGVRQDDSGLHLINFPPTAYVFNKGQPSGWVHATLRPQGVRLELRCLDRTHPAHGQIADLAWRA
ncbi:MAG TPA: metallophosphoesterase [Verrucomicrobiae bacterium]|jgi:3',5'-cyclic AMP phosphodiesterase CpdA|nr:metallophosphoesterase [Verrucomicrobiae bacterium]